MNKNILIAIAALAVIVLGGRKITLSSGVRGLRNNNPGNIRETTGGYWEGQTGTDGSFAIFAAPEYGIRALARVLMTYENKHKLTTVRGVINRYAPGSENDTDSYISHVASTLGIDPDTNFSPTARLSELIPVIIKHENGQQPYSQELIALGVRMSKETFNYA